MELHELDVVVSDLVQEYLGSGCSGKLAWIDGVVDRDDAAVKVILSVDGEKRQLSEQVLTSMKSSVTCIKQDGALLYFQKIDKKVFLPMPLVARLLDILRQAS